MRRIYHSEETEQALRQPFVSRFKDFGARFLAESLQRLESRAAAPMTNHHQATLPAPACRLADAQTASTAPLPEPEPEATPDSPVEVAAEAAAEGGAAVLPPVEDAVPEPEEAAEH